MNGPCKKHDLDTLMILFGGQQPGKDTKQAVEGLILQDEPGGILAFEKRAVRCVLIAEWPLQCCCTKLVVTKLNMVQVCTDAKWLLLERVAQPAGAGLSKGSLAPCPSNLCCAADM